MPIIINELVFKGAIEGARSEPREKESSERVVRRNDRALIETCVEEALKALQRQRER